MVRGRKCKDVPELAPKLVRPKAIRDHGLFGTPHLKEHLRVDDRWKIETVTEQYKNVGDIIDRHRVFKRLEWASKLQKYRSDIPKLREQANNGRRKLHMALKGDNSAKIGNMLINHREMKCLYQKMPIHIASENIDHKTFAMRKKRDSLQFRLKQLQEKYRTLLLEKAMVETRIKFQDDSEFADDTKCREVLKKIENSYVRGEALQTIQKAYKKMIQISNHDALSYEAILDSLTQDVKDQTDFINYVLYLCTPAIDKFKELSQEYRTLDYKDRKETQEMAQDIADFRNKGLRRSLGQKLRQLQYDPHRSRYLRETKTMMALKVELEHVENIVKSVKLITLSTNAPEIFPRIINQDENNFKLKKTIEKDTLGHEMLETKMQFANVLASVLQNNSSEEESDRLNRIRELQEALKEEYAIQEDSFRYLKNRANALVMFRWGLWHLAEVLRHVGRTPRAHKIKYQQSYLMLPLLKFEYITMRAYPPDPYEINVDTILEVVKQKVNTLMTAYKIDISREQMRNNKDLYHELFLQSMDVENQSGEEEEQEPEDEDELFGEIRTLQIVPDRKYIKALSASIIEEHARIQEEL